MNAHCARLFEPALFEQSAGRVEERPFSRLADSHGSSGTSPTRSMISPPSRSLSFIQWICWARSLTAISMACQMRSNRRFFPQHLKLERTLYSTLTFGISKQKIDDKEVLLFGAGMRRRAQLWLNHDEALQVDAEFFVPFLILPNHDHGPEVSSSSVRSICAGITLKNTREQALRPDKDDKIVAMRFNLRIPFKAGLLTKATKTSRPNLEHPRSTFKRRSRTRSIGRSLRIGKSFSKSTASGSKSGSY